MSNRPSWVVGQLAQILGLDEATVTEAILPELESQQHQVRLQSHLQDFLGPSAKAKAFIEKYIALRFPSISPPAPTLPPSFKSGTTAKYKVGSGYKTPASSRVQTNFSSSPDVTKEITDAFGRKGVVYNKHAADGSLDPLPSRAHTPALNHAPTHYRQAGRLTIHEAKMKPSTSDKGKSRAGTPGAGAGSGSGGKGDKIWDLPKSAEVKRIEELRDKLRNVQDGAKVSREGDVPDCFCQARVHPLSAYTPQCPHCGLVLCELHPAYLPCPSCVSSLYSPAQLARLILRLGDKVEAQLQQEQDDRNVQERERRDRLVAASGGGAFPALAGSAGSSAPVTRPSSADQSRKVLSIGGGGGTNGGKGMARATVTTTTYRTASLPSAGPAAADSIPTDIVPRPRSPPVEASRRAKELDKIIAWRDQEDRPWGDVKGQRRGEVWAYVPLPAVEVMVEGRDGRRKMARKKKDEVKMKPIPGAA